MWKCPKCGKEFKNINQNHYCGEKPKTVDTELIKKSHSGARIQGIMRNMNRNFINLKLPFSPKVTMGSIKIIEEPPHKMKGRLLLVPHVTAAASQYRQEYRRPRREHVRSQNPKLPMPGILPVPADPVPHPSGPPVFWR